MKPKRIIFLADCQSFYASVEKAASPQYRDRPLVVCGDPKRRSGIILAACPIAKSFGVTTAESVRESLAKCPNLIMILPRMQQYIYVSLQITKIYESYSNLVEPFSIDEQFLDVSQSLSYFGCSAVELAQHIRMRVMIETGVNIRIGISENKILSKISCDLFAKKNQSGVFELAKSNISDMWGHSLDKMFGVGTKTMLHLHRMGITNIGELAATPLDVLKRKMRVLHNKNTDIWSEVLWRTANGLDESPVTPDAMEAQKGIGRQTTLPVDYHKLDDLLVVILELSALVCQRSREKHYQGNVVRVGCQGADFDRPTGFSRETRINPATNITRELFAAAKKLFQKNWNGLPVRKVFVSLGDLILDDFFQLTLFNDRLKLLKLENTIDSIKAKHGETSIHYAASLMQTSQLKFLSQKIGGHFK